MEIECSISIQNGLGFLREQGNREERKVAAHFGKVLEYWAAENRKSESALFGRGERREEDRADMRDPLAEREGEEV